MQQFSNGFLPKSFTSLWTTRDAYREFEGTGAARYVLRNNDELYLPPARLKSSEKAPYYLFPRKWQEFPNYDIKIIRNKIEFNVKLKTLFLDELKSVYNCGRLLCPHCNFNVPINENLPINNNA
jgi:hypothetical protein